MTAQAQQTIPVVGFVFSGTASSAAAPYMTAFKLGLEAVGFIEGQNVAIEYHLPHGHDEGMPALMTELVQRQVAVIAGDTSPAIAAKTGPHFSHRAPPRIASFVVSVVAV
jgi:hypothetical protein